MDTDDLARQLAETATRAGLDKAAQILADWLEEQRGDDELSDGTQHYLDGIDDAIVTLAQHGATDPR